MSKYCANCGTLMDEDAVFCDNCGAKDTEMESPPSEPMNKPELVVRKKSFSKLIGIVSLVVVLAFGSIFIYGLLNAKKDNSTATADSIETSGVEGIQDATVFSFSEISGEWVGFMSDFSSDEGISEGQIGLRIDAKTQSTGVVTLTLLSGVDANGDEITDAEPVTFDCEYSNGLLTFAIPESAYVFEMLFFEQEGEIFGNGFTNEVDNVFYKIMVYREN